MVVYCISQMAQCADKKQPYWTEKDGVGWQSLAADTAGWVLLVGSIVTYWTSLFSIAQSSSDTTRSTTTTSTSASHVLSVHSQVRNAFFIRTVCTKQELMYLRKKRGNNRSSSSWRHWVEVSSGQWHCPSVLFFFFPPHRKGKNLSRQQNQILVCHLASISSLWKNSRTIGVQWSFLLRTRSLLVQSFPFPLPLLSPFSQKFLFIACVSTSFSRCWYLLCN